MTAKEYLQRLESLDIKIKQKKRELEMLRTETACVNGIDYTKTRVQTSKNLGAAYESAIEKIIEIEEEISREIKEYIHEMHKIINLIHKLKDKRYISLLYKRYVEFKQLEVIAKEMGYAYEWVRELHGQAVQSFSDLMKTELPTQTYTEN